MSGPLSAELEWTNLPIFLLFVILDKLLEPIDHVRFAAVCKEWRSLAKDYNHTTQRWRKVLPMLIVPTEPEGKQQLLYSVSQGKIYNKDIQLPVPNNKRCRGFSHGWLATIDGLTITLLKLFTKAHPIHLPPLDAITHRAHKHQHHEDMVLKVILSADPTLNPDNYMVIAVLYHAFFRLAFIKRGQTCWTYINEEQRGNDLNDLTDAIFYKSQVYAVGTVGMIVSLNVNSSAHLPEIKILAHENYSLSEPYTVMDRSYIVESTKGDLWHVQRFVKKKTSEGLNTRFWIESFRVYKLVFDNRNESIMQKVEGKSLGGEALFLGDNQSVSVLGSNFPKCQPNSIYYTDDFIKFRCFSCPPFKRPCIMGIFNLEDGTSTHLPSPNPRLHLQIPPSHWIVPPFNGLC